ncbi:MAG: hypothetical protein EU535_01200 [Promethearchaeota archaeon]|nr:MAG: hypothetical protein EU535_01200 [Candidatus Lokiarchaeota archaeon]
MESKIKNWEIIGVFFLIIVGSFFHFLFEISNYNIVVAAFAAVNESVWEHLKLAFFPLLIFSIIEYYYIKELTTNFIIAKAVAGYLMPFFIVIIFYSYTAVLGDNLLIFDVLSFIIAVFVGQLISYKILILPVSSKSLTIISWIAIIMLAIIFVLFTYFPPELPIFQDSTNGQYGIVRNHSQHSTFILI